jgi:4a-hydroxytetrahydrobiopterin dehydratase
MAEKTAEKTYTPAEIAARLAGSLSGWTFKDGQLCRAYKTRNWPETLMLANAIGYLAEVAWHHPDLALAYASVEVRLSTHSAGGITEKDFALAQKIEALAAWDPVAEGSALEGRPKK